MNEDKRKRKKDEEFQRWDRWSSYWSNISVAGQVPWRWFWARKGTRSVNSAYML
jgi:hypothetical protein